MQFSLDDAKRIAEALGIQTESVSANQLAQIAHDTCSTDTLHGALQAFLMNKFAPEVIRALPDAERARLANRVAPQLVAIQQKRPSRWDVSIFGAQFKPCVRVTCPVCTVSDGFFPLDDKGRLNVSYPTVEEQMANARKWRFKHCGREESAPQATLAEFERKIKPFCHGYQPTAGDYEAAQAAAATAAVGNRHFVQLSPENYRPDTNN